MEKINKPDTVAIICKKVRIKYGEYLLIPEEISLGTINSNHLFTTENEEYTLALAEDLSVLESDFFDKVYIYPISLEELKDRYQDILDDTILMFHYYLDSVREEINLKLTEKGMVVDLDNQPLFLPKAPQEKKLMVTKLMIPNSGLEYLSNIDNFALENYVKERVFDADDIIEDICTTIAMNYSATNSKDMRTMLSIGPTGSGKTMTYQVIAEYLGVPLTIYDCNSLTSAGYVGKDIEDVLREVYKNAKKKIEPAQKSILVLDEVDKLAARGSDVKDTAVQQALLKLLEGFKYSFPVIKNGQDISFDTSFMTIACLGAFSSIFEQKKKKIGIVSKEEDNQYEVTDEDLVEYGMIRELVGRWKHLFVYKAQTKESLKRILLESKWSPLLLQQNRYLEQFNAELIWNEEFIDAYIEETVKRKSGGRSLSKISANTFVKIDRELLRMNRINPNVKKKVLVTSETIYDNKKFQI